MVYKRYQSPFESTKEEFINPSVSPPEPCAEQEHIFPPDKNRNTPPASLGFLDSLASDDIILIGLIIILLAENKENRDVPLILTLGFLFLVQYIDAD